MRVQLGESRVELEVPLTETADDRVTVAIRGGDILVATARPTGISARTVIQGTITRLERHGPTVLARVASADVSFTVHLTPASLEDLHLSDGSPVWLIIKTYSCRIAAG
jgi:molybdate transport system ATP-binding protein